MAGNLKFEHFCELLEKIARSPKEKKIKHLKKVISSVKESSTSLGVSLFTIIRLLEPKLDSERKTYGIKEHTLAKKYIRILCLPKDGVDANRLLKFRTPTAGNNTTGDFADVAYWVLKSRCQNGGKLTVQEVDLHLDKIATLHASHKPRGIDDELTNILFKMSAEEQKWFIRILLQDLRLGLGAQAVLHAIHPDAKELFDVSTNTRKVCETLKDSSKRLHEIYISLFAPCNPMLSKRLDILEVGTILSKAPFSYVEKKHDGERTQIHVDDGKFKYFSRRAVDYSSNYGESARSGILTPLLAKQLHGDVHSCILDGEMMGWNTKLKCFGSKAMKFDVKNLKEGAVHRACFCVFDILLLNGEVLTNKPLQERIKYLKKSFTPLDGVIMATPQKCVTKSSEVVDALNDAIDNHEEGLILKHPFSVYKPATKTGGWYKIKPEYTIGLSDELDLIIMGGYYGGGNNNAKIITHFLVGVAVPPCVEGADPTEFHSVGRVGSGYSVEELRELLDKLSPHWKPVKGAQMPHGLVWTKYRPDLWIEPCNSQILQIKAAEILESNQYKTGYTFRSPSVDCVRYDKKWSECCTTTEFEKLRLSNCGKLTNRHVSPSELAETSVAKRPRTKAAPVVGQDYQAADLTNMSRKGSLLSGREICILSGNDKITKQDLEKMVYEQGGIIVQHRGPETFCVVAGKKDFRFRNLLEKGDVDVATVEWCLHVLKGERPLEWAPQDLLAMSNKTRINIERKYDEFFDSYLPPTTEEGLKMSLEKVFQEGAEIHVSEREMEELDTKLFHGRNKFAVFRGVVAHFISPKKEELMFTCELYKAMFCFQGGQVSELDNDFLTHVIIDKTDLSSFESMKKLNRSRRWKLLLVTYDWIAHSWTERERLKEVGFQPNKVS